MSDTKAEVNIQARIAELNNVNRIVSNAINLINDVEIKGGHAGPVAEILGWLSGFSKSLTTQVTTLNDALPKPEAAKPVETLKVVEPEVVKV